MSLHEFIALQYFFEKLDIIKAKCATMRYIDYNSFLDIIDEFVSTEPYCVKHKIVVPEHLAKCIFLMLDYDDSGEIEPPELAIFDRAVMGKADRIAKDDAQKQLIKYLTSTKQFFRDIVGF